MTLYEFDGNRYIELKKLEYLSFDYKLGILIEKCKESKISIINYIKDCLKINCNYILMKENQSEDQLIKEIRNKMFIDFFNSEIIEVSYVNIELDPIRKNLLKKLKTGYISIVMKKYMQEFKTIGKIKDDTLFRIKYEIDNKISSIVIDGDLVSLTNEIINFNGFKSNRLGAVSEIEISKLVYLLNNILISNSIKEGVYKTELNYKDKLQDEKVKQMLNLI